MRRIIMVLIAIVFVCPAIISIAVHLYHLQFARFYQYATSAELKNDLLKHLQIGETTRPQAESILQELGINNCIYKLFPNGEEGGSLECIVLSPRPESHNSLFDYLFIVDYYNIFLDFEPEKLGFLLVHARTNFPTFP